MCVEKNLFSFGHRANLLFIITVNDRHSRLHDFKYFAGGSKLVTLLLYVEPHLTFTFDGKTCLLLWQSQMLCGSFKEQIQMSLFLTPNVETNLRALLIPDSFESLHLKYSRPAWEQTHDILLSVA